MLKNQCAVMVDIETLSTHPNATILSIGAILFDPYQQNNIAELTKHTFYATCSVESQPASHVDPATEEWWSKQSPEAFAAARKDPVHISEALKAFHNFAVYRGDCAHIPTATEVWANSPYFDCVIIESAFRAYSKFKFPLPFYAWRDVRTVKAIAWDDAPVINVGVAHNAVDDCIKQAAYVQAAYKHLGLSH